MERRVRLRTVNPHIICCLCKGYMINATTITECLHTCESLDTSQHKQSYMTVVCVRPSYDVVASSFAIHEVRRSYDWCKYECYYYYYYYY